MPEFKNQNIYFRIFSMNSFRNELHIPFLIPMTPHMWNFYFVCRGVPKLNKNNYTGCPKSDVYIYPIRPPNIYIYIYLNIFYTSVCKKIILIKAKKYIVLGIPKVLWEGVKLNLKKNHRGIRKKCWLKIFWVKCKNANGFLTYFHGF